LKSRKTRPTGQAAALVLCASALVTGCRSYQPQPLTPTEHREAWHRRTPSDESVRAFAQRLSQEGDDSAASFDPADGVSLAEAELVALIYNPDLRLARLDAGVAEASAKYAGRWDDPELEAELLRVTENVSKPWVLGAGLSITLPISGRLEIEKAQARAEQRVALQRIAEAEWQTRHALREAWFDWSAAALKSQEQAELIKEVDRLEDSMRQLADAGEASPIEAAVFTLERTQRLAAMVRSRGEAAELEQRVRALMGMSPDADLRLLPAVSLSNDEDPPSLAGMGEHNPTLIRLSEAYDAAEQNLRREIRKQVPDLTIGALYEREDGQSKVGLAGGIPLPILNLNRRAIVEAKAERALARAQFETEYEKLAGQFAAAQLRLQSLRTEHEVLVQQAVPLIDKQLADARQLLEIGESDTLVLLDSLTRAYDTKLRLIEVRQEESQARARLRLLAGPDPEDDHDTDTQNNAPASVHPAEEMSS